MKTLKTFDEFQHLLVPGLLLFSYQWVSLLCNRLYQAFLHGKNLNENEENRRELTLGMPHFLLFTLRFRFVSLCKCGFNPSVKYCYVAI